MKGDIEKRLKTGGLDLIRVPRALMLFYICLVTSLATFIYFFINLYMGHHFLAIQNVLLTVTTLLTAWCVYKGKFNFAINVGFIPVTVIYSTFMTISALKQLDRSLFLILAVALIVTGPHVAALIANMNIQFVILLSIHILSGIALVVGNLEEILYDPALASGILAVGTLSLTAATGSWNTNKFAAKMVRYREVQNREIHHRIKNEMNMLLSVLKLETLEGGSPEELGYVDREMKRIVTLLTMHDELYQASHLEQVFLESYLDKLATTLVKTFSLDSDDVTFSIECSGIYISGADATKIGLIVNELIVNSLKYAFDRNGGHFKLDIQKQAIGVLLYYSDNGMNRETELAPGFGMKFIDLIAQEMGGQVVRSYDNGFNVKIELPKLEWRMQIY